MNLLFCDDPLAAKPVVDADYADEWAAAERSGLATHLFSYEVLTKDEDAHSAIRKIKRSDTLQLLLYRGWMLKPRHYA